MGFKKVAPALAAAIAVFALGAAGTTPAQAATSDLGSFSLAQTYIDGTSGSDLSAKTMYLGNNGSLPITIQYAARAGSVPRVTLQRSFDGSSWTDVAAVNIKTPASDYGSAIAQTPRYATSTKSQKVFYRIYSAAYSDGAGGGIDVEDYSKPFTFVYENQAKYTGRAKAMYASLKPYCKYSAVHVVSSSKMGPAGDYATGGLLIRFNSGSMKTMSKSYNQSLALHECAHEHQFLNYGATYAGWEQMEKAAAKIYKNDSRPKGKKLPYNYIKFPQSFMKFSSVEHAADCAAQAMHKGGYLGYGGYCNPKELAAGKRLMKGGRY